MITCIYESIYDLTPTPCLLCVYLSWVHVCPSHRRSHVTCPSLHLPRGVTTNSHGCPSMTASVPWCQKACPRWIITTLSIFLPSQFSCSCALSLLHPPLVDLIQLGMKLGSAMVLGAWEAITLIIELVVIIRASGWSLFLFFVCTTFAVNPHLNSP